MQLRSTLFACLIAFASAGWRRKAEDAGYTAPDTPPVDPNNPEIPGYGIPPTEAPPGYGNTPVPPVVQPTLPPPHGYGNTPAPPSYGGTPPPPQPTGGYGGRPQPTGGYGGRPQEPTPVPGYVNPPQPGGEYGKTPIPCKLHSDCYDTREPLGFYEMHKKKEIKYGKTGCMCVEGTCRIEAFKGYTGQKADCVWCGDKCKETTAFFKILKAQA